MRFGTLLKKIRIESNWSQCEVAKSIGVKNDTISKIERGERITSSEIVRQLSLHFGIDERFLLNHFYSDLLYQYIFDYPYKNEVLELLKNKLSNENQSIRIPEIQNKGRKKRNKTITNVLKYGKVMGFNYYFQRNEKLKKRERESLIRKSEGYFRTVQQMKGNSTKIEIPELDNNMTDIELMEHWNRFFELYGNQFPEFRKIIQNDRIRKSKNKKKVRVNYQNKNSMIQPRIKNNIDF